MEAAQTEPRAPDGHQGRPGARLPARRGDAAVHQRRRGHGDPGDRRERSHLHPDEGADDARGRPRRGAEPQAGRRGARALAAVREPRRRRAGQARPRRAHRGPRGPPPAPARADRVGAAGSPTGSWPRGSRASASSPPRSTTSERERLDAALDAAARARGDLGRLPPVPKAGHTDDPIPPPDHRRQPQVVDARRDVLRAVHDHARQHRRERRAAVDPGATSAPASPASSGRSTATRSASASCWSPAGGSATSSAAGGCSCSASRSSRSPRRPPASRRTPTMLIVSRVVQGVGGGADDARRRSRSSPTPSRRTSAARRSAPGPGVSALALAIGPVVGGLLTEHVSWRAIFYLNIPVAIGAVAATALRGPRVARRDGRPRGRLPRRRRADRRAHGAGPRPDRGQRVGLGLDRDRRACSRGSVVALAAFVVIERRVPAPMVEFRLFASRNFVGAILVALIVTFAMLAPFFFLALYMQDILGYSPLEAGRPLPARDPDDRRCRAARRPAHRPHRPALADRRPGSRSSPSRCSAYDDRRRHHLRRHLPGVHADGHRDRADDVADVDRRDERGRRSRRPGSPPGSSR